MRFKTSLLIGFVLLAAGTIEFGAQLSNAHASGLQSDNDPKILSARVKGKNLIVIGENFAEGAMILVNGEPQDPSKFMNLAHVVTVAARWVFVAHIGIVTEMSHRLRGQPRPPLRVPRRPPGHRRRCARLGAGRTGSGKTGDTMIGRAWRTAEMGLELAEVPHHKGGVAAAMEYLVETAKPMHATV